MESVTKLHFRQYRFLRDLREAAETGLCDRPWPRVTTLRRWLRRPGFRAALKSLQSALRFQRDWMLSVSAAQASRNLAAMVSEQDPRCGLPEPDLRLATLVRIIRTEQIRQRESARRRKQPQPLPVAGQPAPDRHASRQPALTSDRPAVHQPATDRPGEVGGDMQSESLVLASWADQEHPRHRDTGEEANGVRSRHRPAGLG